MTVTQVLNLSFMNSSTDCQIIYRSSGSSGILVNVVRGLRTASDITQYNSVTLKANDWFRYDPVNNRLWIKVTG